MAVSYIPEGKASIAEKKNNFEVITELTLSK